MRHRFPRVLALFAITAALGLSPILVTAQDDASGVSFSLLGSGKNVQLYRFSFIPGSMIPYPTANSAYPDGYPEAMLISVTNGPFVIYTRSGTPPGGGEPIPGAPIVLKIIEGEITTLTDLAGEEDVVEYDSTQTETTGQECPGSGARTCILSSSVGVVLESNTVVLLEGPTFCLICYIGDDLEAGGELEVAAASPPGAFSWTKLPGVTEGTATPAAMSGRFKLASSVELRGSELPPLNPGTCSGRVQ